MFESHLIDNIKNKQYTNLKVVVLLQPLKRETKILYILALEKRQD